MSNRDAGVVKWFSIDQGHGIIEREDGEEIYVTQKDIRGDGYRKLEEGMYVKFDVIKEDDGLKAKDVLTIRMN